MMIAEEIEDAIDETALIEGMFGFLERSDTASLKVSAAYPVILTTKSRYCVYKKLTDMSKHSIQLPNCSILGSSFGP